MIALLTKTVRVGFLLLLFFSYFAMNLQAQSEATKTVMITLTSTDDEGNATVEKIVKTGAQASEEAIDKIVQDALKSNKAIDIEVEQTESLAGDKGITKTLERFTNQEGADRETDIEITLDGEGKIASEKIVEKEVHITKTTAGSEEDVEKILKKHGIDPKDMDSTGKEVRIIKMKVDGEEDIDINEILEQEGIQLDDMEGKQKRVRIIKKDKSAEEKEHTIIKLGDSEEEASEDVMIFEGEDGTTKVIKKKKGEKMTWTQREDVEEKIKKMGITLPAPAPPVANYVNAVRSDKLIFMAGKGPNKPEGGYITGKVGKDLSVEEGYEAARLAGIIQLAALKAEIGDLNRVKRIVKVTGMVNATADFTNHPEVINGFSDLMVEVFGERGKHARAAVGMHSLPRNIAVEVEMVVEIE